MAMSPSDIEMFLAMTPFKPLRFTLSSGDQFVVERQFRTMVGDRVGDVDYLYVSLSNDRDSAAPRQVKLISTVSIAMIERLDAVPPPTKSRRRR